MDVCGCSDGTEIAGRDAPQQMRKAHEQSYCGWVNTLCLGSDGEPPTHHRYRAGEKIVALLASTQQTDGWCPGLMHY